LAAGGLFEAKAVLAALPADGKAYEIAAALTFEDSARAREVLEQSIAKLTAYHMAGRYRGKFEVPPDEEAPAPVPLEDYGELEKEVAELVNRGEATDDHPKIMQYKAVSARVHGKGRLEYVASASNFAVWELAPAPAGEGAGTEVAPLGAVLADGQPEPPPEMFADPEEPFGDEGS
jgi:hypothetical protein